MEDLKVCQSCGMPLGENDDIYATEKDGSKNPEYCIYCRKDGEFTSEMSMDEMIDFCVPYMVKDNEDMTEENARQMMKEFFPSLKRWKAS